MRFLPPDDEGFTLRGDSWRLVYKGRRRSHRFTILGDGAFEYDVILNREPESNIIALKMEGAGDYDFFRQPDFIKEPLLAGSYAVYKKETLVGEGTGKLCHIHRPEIIDARGRRVWGDLFVSGDTLYIKIPEEFLSNAAYPVIVDPTIGTTTIGSMEKYYDPEHHDADDEGNWRPLFFEICVAVNQFIVSQAISGNCTAYVYPNSGDGWDDNFPVIFSDNNNKPLNKLSKNETAFNLNTENQPKSWRSVPFKVKNPITTGSKIWFGVCSGYWEARFDYGQRLFSDEFDYDYPVTIPEVYPQEYIGWYDTHPQDVQTYYNFKVSWYFTYNSAQSYTRTITQGVTLTDSRKITGNYKRSASQNVRGTATAKGPVAFFRQCLNTVFNTMSITSFPVFIRRVVESIQAYSEMYFAKSILIKISELVHLDSLLERTQGFFRAVSDHITNSETFNSQCLFYRSISSPVTITEVSRQWRVFIRGITETPHITVDTSYGGEYYRGIMETVQAAGPVFRGLLLFVKIVTGLFVRDYLIGRFLKAREEIAVKSPVCRELILDSRIH